MSYPYSMGDNQDFREDFTNWQTIADNGGVNNTTTPAVISGGQAICTGRGISYADFDETIFEGGGTVKIKFTVDTVVTNTTVMATGDGSTNGWHFGTRTIGADVRFKFQQITAGGVFRGNGSTNLEAGVEYEIVFTYNSDNLFTHPVIYLNKVKETFAVNEATGTSAVTGVHGLVIGDRGGAGGVGLPMTVDTVSVYNDTWDQQTVTDEYNGTTYSALDASKSLIYADGRSRWDNGSNIVTRNLGSEGNLLMGDGSTSGTFPVILQPHGFEFDDTDYLKSQNSLSIAPTESLVFHCRLKITGTGATDYLLDLRNLSTRQGLAVYKAFTGEIVTFTHDGVLDALVGNKNIEDGKERSLAVVFNNIDSGNLKASIYLDGDLDATGIIGTYTAIGDPAYIGVSIDIGSYVNGTMKDIGFWKTTGTPRQVRWLHERSLKEMNL